MVSLQHMKYVIANQVSIFDKNMNVCLLVVHDLTNNISWIDSKFAILEENSKTYVQKSREIWKYLYDP